VGVFWPECPMLFLASFMVSSLRKLLLTMLDLLAVDDIVSYS